MTNDEDFSAGQWPERTLNRDFFDFSDLEIESPVKIEGDVDYIYSLTTKAVGVCASYGFSPSGRWSKIIGSEVGDDRVDLSSSPYPLALEIVVQEDIFGMVTSQDDTCISKELFNFCEVTTTLPTCVEESFDYARRTGKPDLLGFTDTIPIRTIIDTGKDDFSHSSTTSGKAKLASGRLGINNPQFRLDLQIASFLQDGYLSTWRTSSEPKYIPQFAGGAGCPPLFDKGGNLYLSVHGYKMGGYDRIYGSAINEMKSVLKNIEEGLPDVPILCKKLRMGRDYLMATFANVVVVPAQQKRSVLQEHKIPPPLYEELGSTSLIRATEHRLERARFIVNEDTAYLEWDRNVRFQEILLGIIPVKDSLAADKYQKARDRENYYGAVRSNSAIKNLIDRCAGIDDLRLLDRTKFLFCNYGESGFHKEHANWILAGAKGEYLNAEQVYIPQAMYSREDVSVETCLKVGGIPLLSGDDNTIRYTTTRVGLYEISASQYEWAQATYNRLLQSHPWRPIPRESVIQAFSVDREWVNDDSLIIGEVLEETKGMPESISVGLVSADIKLARKLANTVNILVVLVHPLDAIKRIPRVVWNSQTTVSPEELLRAFRVRNPDRGVRPYSVKIDTGSVASFASNIIDERGERKMREVVEIVQDAAGVVNPSVRYSYSIPSRGWDTMKMIVPTSTRRRARYRAPPVDTDVQQ